MGLSRSQIDRLGERLRRGTITEADLRLLDEYRSSFDSAYQAVIHTVSRTLRKRPSGRPRKTVDSIVAKLNRETIRLSQMQDIAGCRLVVRDVDGQERMVHKLVAAFPETTVVDRRQRPSHGYRAVHVIATVGGKSIEIQIRTGLQDLWAQLSEKMADALGKDLKYGGGPGEERWQLDLLSEGIKRVEIGEYNRIESSQLRKLRSTVSKALKRLVE